MKSLKPSAEWEFKGKIPEIAAAEPDHAVWWHLGRRLTAVSGICVNAGSEWIHVSVSRWSPYRAGPARASDGECAWALEQFSFPGPPYREITGPDQVSRDFLVRADR